MIVYPQFRYRRTPGFNSAALLALLPIHISSAEDTVLRELTILTGNLS
jgi:hypothetical protein